MGKRALVYLGMLAFALVLLLVFNANSGNASAVGPTYVYDDIDADATWTEADSPYIVNDSIAILPGVTLTIGPNVTVMVDNGERIDISGTLIAQGNATNPVIITSNSTTPFAGIWDGLFFSGESSDSVMEWVMVEYAGYGASIVNTSVAMSNVMLQRCGVAGLWWEVNDGSDLVLTLADINASECDGIGMQFMVNGGSADVTLENCAAWYNLAPGIVIEATGDVSAEIIDTAVKYTMDIGIVIYSTAGNAVADLTNVEVQYCTSFGVLVWSVIGDATVTMDPSSISDTDESGLQIEALGAATLTVTDSAFERCYAGITIYGDDGDMAINLQNVSFVDCWIGLLADVNLADVTLIYDTVSIDGCMGGLAVMSADGNVSAELAEVSWTDNAFGSMFMAGGNVDLNLVDCSFSADWYSEIQVYAGGNADVTVTGTTMTGAANLNSAYYAYEIEPVYDIINPAGNLTSGSSMNVVLPFEFPYDNNIYTDVWVYRNGYISLGVPYGGSFPISLSSTGSNVIVPCQDNFVADQWPYYGYKVYDDRIVFQWFVWRSAGASYLKNVFEVVLYPDGDIQFNYADMQGVIASDWSNDYGLGSAGTLPVVLNDVLEPNVYDMDYRSVYFDMQLFSGGPAMVIQAEGDVDFTVTDSTVANYYDSGAIVRSYDGSISLEIMNSTFEYFICDDSEWNCVIDVTASNGTIMATIEDSTFSNIANKAIILYSQPYWGGEDTVTMTGCTFNNVGGKSLEAWVYVEDDDGFNDIVDLIVTRSIVNNTFTNSAGVQLMTEIYTDDQSAWNVTVSETITGNTFEGTLPGWSLPSESRWYDYSILVSVCNVGSDVEGSSVDKTVEVSGNSIESPIQSLYGILVYDQAYAWDGSMTWNDETIITDNEMTATLGWFQEAVIVYMFGESNDGVLDSTVLVEVSDNSMVGDPLTYYIGIDVEVWQYCEYGDGSGTIEATVNIERNTVTGAWWGIYAYVDASTYNQFGDQTGDFVVNIVDNEVTACIDGAIEVYVYTIATYDSYFPPYETEVSTSQTTTYAVEITGNVIESEWEGIYFYLYSEVQEDSYGVFTHAVIDVIGTVNISDNEITHVAEGWYGIWADLYTYAIQGEADGSWSMTLMINDNVITNTMGYLSFGIYVNDNAVSRTQTMKFEDTPTATATLDLTITGNVISGAEEGIEVDSYPYVRYGMSMMTYQASILISGNELSTIWSEGVYTYIDADTDQFSYYDKASNAVMNVTYVVEISENTISWVEEGGWPYGVESILYYDWDAWAAGQLIFDATAMILDNTITGTGDGSSEGIDIGAEWVDAGVFVVSGNVISDTGYGIYAWYANVTISDNTISNLASYEGIYLYECIGTVSGNSIATGNDVGIYAEYSWLLTIEGNSVDACDDGIYLYDCWDSVVSDNTLTNNGLESGDTFGLYLYDCYNITVSDNVMTGNYYGMAAEYCDLLVIEGNTIDRNLNGGAELWAVYGLTIEDNSFSENGGDGLWIVYCYDVVLIDNVANENDGYGVYAYNDDYDARLTIYNGEYADNVYDGLFVELYDWGVDWIIDGVAELRNNGAYIWGDITVMDGGVLTLDTVIDLDMANDNRDGMASIIVEEGGTLIARNSEIDEDWDTYLFEVYGTLDMQSCTVWGARELYLGPTSTAEIRTSVITEGYRNGIHVDDCAPVISGTKVVYNWMDGIFIEGENAAPKIFDCIIAYNERGIYALKSNLADVVDNIIAYNYVAGIYAYDSDGNIHDNVMLFNAREIWVKDSTVSIQNNEIGYSMLVNVMAEYLPLLGLGGEGFDGLLPPEMMVAMMVDHIGIYAENSVVEATDNVYGLLSYAVYVVDSELTFSDDVKKSQLRVPYFDSMGVLWNITVPIYVYDGIYAADSTVVIDGAYIEVLDDAVFLENSNADIRNSVLNATDVDLYVTDGSSATATEVTFDGKILVTDTSMVTVNYKLTVNAVDQDGEPVSGVWVVVRNAAGDVVDEGATGDDGKWSTYVVGFIQTSAGVDTGMNPYLVNASFEQGAVEESVMVDGPTELTVEVPVDKPEPIDLAPIAGIALIAVVIMAMLLLVTRGRP